MATENLALEVFQQNSNLRSPPAEINDTEENRNAVDRPGGPDQENAELIVLDPNHDEELKREKAAHVETGCELYNFQQDLAKFQVQLEKKHAEYTESLEKAEAAQTQLKELRENYRQVVKSLTDDTKTMHEMRDEVDALCLRLYYLNNAREEVLGDIKVMKRAAEKATIDLSKHENEKLRQDLLVDRIQTKVDQLKEDIALYEAQITAQEAEMEISQNLLHEAEAQIVSISVDRKNLLAQWNTSLLGLQRRNEAYAALMKAYNELKERLLVLENEQVAYRRSIIKEQETHEQLTMLVNKNEADLNTLKKQILHSQTKHEADKQTYSTYSRMLQETERNLGRAQAEQASCQATVDGLRKQIEKETLKKTELENKITSELRDRLTTKKAMEYVQKLNLQVQDQSREVITQIAQLENQIARDDLATAVKRSENQKIQEQIQEVEREIDERNSLINKLEAEIHHATVMVERKQSAIDLLNKKLERLLHETGGQEVGPLETMINSLTKAVQTKQDEIGELEQQWLKEQNELVRHVNEREGLTRTVERLQKQLTILSQKKLRVDNEIAIQEREKAELERELKHLQYDTVRLNAMIAKEKSTGENLSNENRLAETDFVRALREKEMEAAELQSKVESLRAEREDMLNELVEVERTIMLWEKKVQLCEETRHAVDCDLGQGELNVMKHEIHRMEVRKSSLLQQQEKLLQALERSVAKRDLIVLQAETQRTQKNRTQIRITVQRQLDELKKKLKATKQLAKTCTTETSEMEENLVKLEQEITSKRSELEEQQKYLDELTDKLQDMADEKQKYVFEIQLKQHETVYWEQVREGRYRRLCPSSGAITAEITRQLNRIRTLLMVLDKLLLEFPQMQRELTPLRKILENRLKAEESKDELEASAIFKKKDSRKGSGSIDDSLHKSPSR
ncbi:Coiled-coil domain-containing protein 40 [Paragonimus heterotremus]|uniref:Coiled-coil domain-containing protein 40 n=1 Tax=Paragonimus heterotremus TaxID=100268 RepID=A0A8J4TEH3_9TREM|nr:Coiled-coil domain-containing protein 40 [Paragonimus heterotremus]